MKVQKKTSKPTKPKWPEVELTLTVKFKVSGEDALLRDDDNDFLLPDSWTDAGLAQYYASLLKDDSSPSDFIGLLSDEDEGLGIMWCDHLMVAEELDVKVINPRG